jgi:hypothetical protein
MAAMGAREDGREFVEQNRGFERGERDVWATGLVTPQARLADRWHWGQAVDAESADTAISRVDRYQSRDAGYGKRSEYIQSSGNGEGRRGSWCCDAADWVQRTDEKEMIKSKAIADLQEARKKQHINCSFKHAQQCDRACGLPSLFVGLLGLTDFITDPYIPAQCTVLRIGGECTKTGETPSVQARRLPSILLLSQV